MPKSTPHKLEYMRKYRAANRESEIARTRKWQEENKDKFTASVREYQKAHPEVNKAATKRYREKKRQDPQWRAKKAVESRARRMADPEKARAIDLKSQRKRYSERYPVINSPFRWALKLRNMLWKRLKSQNAKKTASTFDLIGCSINELRNHLQSQFKPGMAWNNYGYRGWHIDHIRPISSFDLLDPEQQRLAFHYTNLQPLWASENLSKSDKF